MTFAALDSPTRISLMVFGAVFALVGLWLLLRPKQDDGAAKIELFGMKFESSSAGLLVFLIGAAFLAVPLFVPVAPRMAESSVAQTADGEVLTTTPAPTLVTTTAPRALTAVGAEIEDNDNIAAANEIAVGSVITGEVAEGDPDFFSFPVTTEFAGIVTVNVTGGDALEYFVYDDLGGQLTHAMGWSPKSAFEAEYTRYYISIETAERHIGYTLTVAARPD